MTAPPPAGGAGEPASAEQMRTAYRAITSQKARIAELETALAAVREPVAIVGIGCRFPGGVRGPEAFWAKLLAGFDAVREVPPERWPVDAYYDANPDAPGKIYTRQGAFLDEVDRFDAGFFGISPREAASMDPQQRLLLETAWEALEHAGIPPPELAGTSAGVFVGLTAIDYVKLVCGADLRRIDAYAATGNVANIAAGRLSYFFGLRGPAVTLDTACSSSLVAVHLACQSLRAGESSLALAAGVNLILAPDNSVAVARARMLSPGGSCRAFDAAADGYVRGEGCGVVVLKLLSRARADGDRILAVVRGSAVGQDGARSGLTVPNGPAQAALIRRALAGAGAAPAEVGYLEAHGTGTALGDPIEAEALAAVFGGDPQRRAPLVLASLKTNLGHMESAAGIGGLIKAVLAVGHGEIPPHLHFQRENPEVHLAKIPARIPTETLLWPASSGRRLAGISSFGSCGTIAHVLVEDAPEAPVAGAGGGLAGWLLLSAKSEPALHELAGRTAAWLAALPPDSPVGDICWTAAAGRAHFSHRLAVCGATAAALTAALVEHAAPPPDSPGARYREGAPPDLAAMFGAWRGRRVTLPSYPFARDRHWVGPGEGPPRESGPVSAPAGGSDAAKPAPEREASDCFLEIAWRPASLLPNPPLPTQPQRWAVIGGGAFGAALVQRLLACGQEAVSAASPSHPFGKPDRLINLQPLDSPASLPDALALVQAGRGRLWTVTRGAQAAGGVVPDREAAALWGLLRVLPVEQPGRWGGLVDLDPAEPLAAQADALWSALTTGSREDQLAWRGGRWLAARLAPRPAADRAAAEAFQPARAGAWLITGGLGGLGWTVAEWLVARGVRELLLLGRSGADAVRRQALEEWKRQGVRAVPVAADCADAPALERALSAWRTGGGARFGGVCHVAGAWQDAPLADLDSAGLDAVWRPKVGGARALERALASDPVGQWIYFSAFSALLPALGQGNYAAANAWLDAQARAQRAGGARALALDWGPWSEAGFALTPYGRRAHERLETLGIARLRPAEGLAVLDRALASGEPQLGAMPVDWPRFFAADPAARLSPLLAELAARHAGAVEADPEEGRIAKAIAACPPAEHAVLLTEEMRRLVGGVLRLAPGQVPADVPFTELGVDSLMAIEIKNRLQRQAGVDVPLTDLLRGPTAGGLAAALLPRAKAAALAHGAPASGPVEEIEI
jgi:acyl transferase domain-containing protein/acyl carrier protein